jgi:hypothetical protein
VLPLSLACRGGMAMERHGAVSCRLRGGRGRTEDMDIWSSSLVAFLRLPNQITGGQQMQASTHRC